MRSSDTTYYHLAKLRTLTIYDNNNTNGTNKMESNLVMQYVNSWSGRQKANVENSSLCMCSESSSILNLMDPEPSQQR